MAAGDLSADQRAYRDRLVRLTGLDPAVVTAWIGAESGWSVTKPGHNYLNIGPGRTYPSVAAAADAAASLINRSHHYDGIRAAIGKSGAHQAQAIASSPWDAGRYGGDGSRLTNVYQQLAGGSPSGTPTATPTGYIEDKVTGAIGAVVRPLAQVAENASERILTGTLTVVFVLAGVGLIVFGLFALTRTATGV